MYEVLSEIAALEKDQIKAQDAIRFKFHELLQDGPLPSWKPGDAIPIAKKRLLVGVAPGWNADDRSFLEWLEKSYATANKTDLVIQLFDADNCLSEEDLRAYMPNIQYAFQYPIVGVWEDGIEINHATGYAARELLREIILPHQ